MEDEELFIGWEVEEILKRYADGEREFLYVDLSGGDLSSVDFGERSLRGVIYNKKIKFSNANLSNANLSSANLRNAFMQFVNLNNANLNNANLERTLLKGANLKGVNLCSTNLAGADLTNADLSGATWGFNPKDAIFNNTILPDGTIETDFD